MDTSNNIYTELLIKHGAVQTQPKYAAALNEGTVSQFISTSDAGPVLSGYQVKLTGYAEFIREKETSTTEYYHLDNLLKGLRSVPRNPDAKLLKGSVSTFKLENRNYRVDYRIGNGQIVVYNIQPIDKLQKMRDKMEQVAVYLVKRNDQGIWQVASRVEKVTTAYAAVNGQSNNLNKATWLMGQHLEFQYKNLNEYTLFHNPSIGGVGDTWESFRDKIGVTTPVTKKFAKLLADTQANNNATKWVAHSQGGAIFAEGVRYLLNGSSSWALNKLQLNGLRNAEKGKLLDKHSIAFHGNANNNIRSKLLMDRAGITIIPGQATDYDFVRNIIGMNTLNPRKLIGSIAYINHVTDGSINQSPHTLAQTQEQWKNNMNNGPGKGRGPVQKTFNKIDPTAKKTTKAVPNYLP